MAKHPISRRTFLRQTAAVAPMILGSGILAANGQPGANDRIVTGHIGVGGMGTHHLGDFLDNVGAICDVDQDHLAKVQGMLPREVDHYTDYRRLLDRKDIDAVLTAAPDHWHGIIAVHACQAGKDVYVEKPACKTIEEGRAMAAAAEKHGRVMVVGSQGRQHPASAATREYILDGQIGEVQRVECWHEDNRVGGDRNKFGPAPANLDWDRWLGPSGWKPYNPDYCHFNFRWMLDWGGGQIRDRGAHVFSVMSWILGLDRKGPIRVKTSGDHQTTGIWDTPLNFLIEYEFEDPKLTVVWDQTGVKHADYPFGAKYVGTKGEVILKGGDGGVQGEQKVFDYLEKKHGQRPPESGDALKANHTDWVNCIKSRKMPLMDIESGHRIASMCILANLSHRLERPLEWDAKTERIVGDEAANRLLGSPGRGEYVLPKV